MDSVTVTFLGSGDAFGSGGRFQTCNLVEAAGHRFLLDCGASSLVALKQRGVSPATIGTILVTHLHGDHFAGHHLIASFSLAKVGPVTICARRLPERLFSIQRHGYSIPHAKETALGHAQRRLRYLVVR